LVAQDQVDVVPVPGQPGLQGDLLAAAAHAQALVGQDGGQAVRRHGDGLGDTSGQQPGLGDAPVLADDGAQGLGVRIVGSQDVEQRQPGDLMPNLLAGGCRRPQRS
jgi:hypothetical protein